MIDDGENGKIFQIDQRSLPQNGPPGEFQVLVVIECVQQSQFEIQDFCISFLQQKQTNFAQKGANLVQKHKL